MNKNNEYSVDDLFDIDPAQIDPVQSAGTGAEVTTETPVNADTEEKHMEDPTEFSQIYELLAKLEQRVKNAGSPASRKHREPSVDITSLQEILEKYLSRIQELVRYNKAKDAQLTSVSNELTKYREKYAYKMVKPIALAVITYREDCKKSLRDVDQFDLPYQKILKYVDYLTDDFSTMMNNLGLEEEDGSFLYNGKRLNESIPDIRLPDAFAAVSAEEVAPKLTSVTDAAGLTAFLEEEVSAINRLLANNEAETKLLNDYIKIAGLFEKDAMFVMIYPLLREIVSQYRLLNIKVAEIRADLNEENYKTIYKALLAQVIDGLSKVLEISGVEIINSFSDSYDIKLDRILKIIDSENQADDRKIVARYTEAYVLEEMVLFQSKVDVLRYKQK